jgi:hypothetical protein
LRRGQKGSGRRITAILVVAASLALWAGPSGATALSSATTYPYSVAQLRRALLARSDLGPSFKRQPNDTSDNTKATGCPKLDADLNATGAPRTPHALINFNGGQDGPFVSEQLVELSAKALENEYNEAEGGMDSCHSFTVATGGTPLTFDLTPVTSSSQAAAGMLRGSFSGQHLTGYIGIEDVKGAELDYLYFQLGPTPSPMGARFFAQAVTKAQKVLG